MAVSGIISATMSYFTHKIEKKFGFEKILIVLPILYSLFSFGLISNIPYVFNMLMGGVIGVLVIVYNDYVNKNIPSEKRATILSMCSMVYSFYMILIFPLFGKLADTYSFEFSFLSVSIIIFIFSLFNVLFNLKLKSYR